ncbi:MAG TPA: biotin--[acetyl-CoA-carboxylase] ligase [Vicinamibacterales bacterium]|nr:biotin--[acetyl-CoA-carboxylase] ligase [Vicinamibacterales bacterium]
MSESLPREIADVLEAAAPRLGHLGRPAYYFSEARSTNDVALALADRGAPEGTIVIAAAQTAGRGRLGRTWHSPPDAGLYVSVICREGRAAPLLALGAGVAVADGITAATGLPVEIKWPNDIVLPVGAASNRRRKLAGVLAEAASGAGAVQHVVVGFGVNLRPSAYPPDVAARATSLEAELGRPVDAGRLLVEILAVLAQAIGKLSAGDSRAIVERCRALSPGASGSPVEFDSTLGRQAGVTAGIAEDGALLVRFGDRVERIIAGELVWM